MKPKVIKLSRKRGYRKPANAVSIAYPTKWRNPFKKGIHGTRDEVVAKHRAWIVQQPNLMAALPKLRGKDLVCSCAPEPCHGDVLIELVNQLGE